jgi:hypothetical protein
MCRCQHTLILNGEMNTAIRLNSQISLDLVVPLMEIKRDQFI